jgi:TetR/AcrR family transcriptional repressor of nem operon
MKTPGNSDRTRERLLGAGFHEINRRGFQPASIDTIVGEAGVTKGALYHHFASKQALGYAVVDEVLQAGLYQRWLRPIERAADPLDALIGSVRKASQGKVGPIDIGCPINNLAQEMSAVDEGFRQRICALYQRWEAGVIRALERGQMQARVRRDVDVAEAATFIVASLAGALGLAKTRKNGAPLGACAAGLTHYLEALRPEGRRPASASSRKV